MRGTLEKEEYHLYFVSFLLVRLKNRRNYYFGSAAEELFPTSQNKTVCVSLVSEKSNNK